VVIEVSNEDFQIGHEATLAIMEKKPVLCLSVNEDLSKRIFDEYFFAAKYNETSIKGVLQDFFAKVRYLNLTKRFNMFLYPRQIDYLKKAATKEGINMSEYIRKLINIDKRLSNPDNY
jgi:predicted DNA binding CopG/RHH family protein